MLQIAPLETLTITPTGSYLFDTYLSKPPVDPAGGGLRREAVGGLPPRGPGLLPDAVGAGGAGT